MDIYSVIVAGHVIGTILGVGGATIAEVQITKALTDKKITPDEKRLMHANYTLIRVGMAVIFLSIVGMFWYHLSQGNQFILTSEKLWIKDLMFVAIVLNAIALTKHWVPLWLGASISLTSWWGAALLGLAGKLPFNFETYLGFYVAAIFIVAGISQLIRQVAIKSGS